MPNIQWGLAGSRLRPFERLPVVRVPHAVDEGRLRNLAIESLYCLFLEFPGCAVVEAGLPVEILRAQARRANFYSPRPQLARRDNYLARSRSAVT
jgi:hypothetical protein